MTENNDNNSFTKRFTNGTPGDAGGDFPVSIHPKTSENMHWGKRKSFLVSKQKTESKEAFSESGSIKSKSRTVNKRSFADAARRSRSDLVYLVRVNPVLIHATLYLNRFRGKPAISKFNWPFTPNHNSSNNVATLTGSILQCVLPYLQSGHD
ncbi:hypothetical protein DINM_001410 [Dirofilaria immitis]|nr:hypothetical protein [Dirofilaria immitis]